MTALQRALILAGIRDPKTPVCPYCGQPSRPVNGDAIYHGRPDLKAKKFWLCKPCHAYIGCHGETDSPLGTLANHATRLARQAAHQSFDRIWRMGHMSRHEAYKWLAERLEVEEIHIGESDVAMCGMIKKVADGFFEK